MNANPSRREAQKTERRAVIVASARVIFLAHGYAATTMTMIAEAIGGSKATLWAYFDSKDAVFRSVIEDLTERFQRDLDSALNPGRDLRETIVGFCQQYMETLLSPQSVRLYRLVIGEGERFPAIGQLFYDRGPRRAAERLASYLQAAIREGSLRQCDTVVGATQLISLSRTIINRYILDSTFKVGPGTLRQHAEETVDMFLSAYGAAATPNTNVRIASLNDRGITPAG